LGLRSRGKWHAPRPSNYKYFGVYDTPGYGWTVQRFRPGVVIVAETPDGATVWIRCRRPYHLEGQNGWELPGGAARDGEPILAAAKRELREETGYSTEDPGRILAEGLEAAPGMGSFSHAVVLLRNCVRTSHQLGEDEEAIDDVAAVDAATVAEWIARGRIQSLPSIAAYHLHLTRQAPSEVVAESDR
jgi:8-oxo-dGTP pyrophosphatase MutT (NUDIX family)